MEKENKITGNIDGIRKSVLEEMEKLFELDMEPLRHQFVSRPLANAMAKYTTRLNRELMVYVARDGHVLEVVVGQHDRVELPAVVVRRGKRRLSGVRAIHTHPDGDARLSGVDIAALHRMRFDAMASIGVRGGHITGMQVAMLEQIDAQGDYLHALYGPFVGDITRSELLERMLANDERILHGARIYTAQQQEQERAILVGIDSQESLAELARLAQTAGAQVLESILQQRNAADASTYVGQGKVGDIALRCQELEATLLIVDDELSGSQIRNMEQLLNCRVIDRTVLILDIFATRATSREGKLQVELAQHKYRLPRLTGAGEALSRLGGGIGTRGPGETKLESDRRVIRSRITDLEREVNHLDRQREVRRAMRQKNQVPGVAIVGYTNAGKSTLLNALSGSSELAEDKLFATLDPVTRRVQIEGRTVLFTDTVGFIKKLPHDLIDAFRSTLEEAVHADILLHVVDASSSESREQYQIATEVLASLGAGDKPVIVAYNKMDAVADEHIPFDCGCPHRCFISAQSGQGIDTLLALVMQLLSESVACLELKVGYGRGDVLSLAHTIGEVKSTEYEADGMRIVVEVPQNAARQLQPYAVAESTH